MAISRLTFFSSVAQFGYFIFDFPSKRKIPKIKVYLEKWKRMVTSTWSTLQCLKQIKKKLKRYRRITNIVMKKQQIAEIEQRLLLREILEIKKSAVAKWKKNSGIIMIDFTVFERKKNWNSTVE